MSNLSTKPPAVTLTKGLKRGTFVTWASSTGVRYSGKLKGWDKTEKNVAIVTMEDGKDRRVEV